MTDEIAVNERTGQPLKWATWIGEGSGEHYHGVPARDLDEADRAALSEDADGEKMIAAVESGKLYRLTPRAKAEAKADAEDEKPAASPSKAADTAPAAADHSAPASAASSARSGRSATTSKDGDA